MDVPQQRSRMNKLFFEAWAERGASLVISDWSMNKISRKSVDLVQHHDMMSKRVWKSWRHPFSVTSHIAVLEKQTEKGRNHNEANANGSKEDVINRVGTWKTFEI